MPKAESFRDREPYVADGARPALPYPAGGSWKRPCPNPRLDPGPSSVQAVARGSRKLSALKLALARLPSRSGEFSGWGWSAVAAGT
jgi:hypothetical protein